MNRALVIGVVATVLALAAVVLAPSQALFGWLAAWAFCAGIPIGTLLLLLIMRVLPGGWSEILAPLAVPVALLVPLAAIAGLPVALDLPPVYPWTAGGLETAFRGAWLSPPAFLLRALLFFAGAAFLAIALAVPNRRVLATAGLVVFVPFHTLVAVDWLMSLDPAFHSSGFGLYVLSMQGLTALAALILIRIALGGNGPPPLGALLLLALLLWAYFAFMQFFIAWSGNLPANAAWYGRRTEGAWAVVFPTVAALNAVPTLLLLFRPFRESRSALAAFAVSILAGKALETAWLVLPEAPAGSLPWLTGLAALTGLACLGVGLAPRARIGAATP